MEIDRTELNDVADKFPEKVKKLSFEWFKIAKKKERLNNKGLSPVSNHVKNLSFRRDTSHQIKD